MALTGAFDIKEVFFTPVPTGTTRPGCGLLIYAEQ